MSSITTTATHFLSELHTAISNSIGKRTNTKTKTNTKTNTNNHTKRFREKGTRKQHIRTTPLTSSSSLLVPVPLTFGMYGDAPTSLRHALEAKCNEHYIPSEIISVDKLNAPGTTYAYATIPISGFQTPTRTFRIVMWYPPQSHSTKQVAVNMVDKMRDWLRFACGQATECSGSVDVDVYMIMTEHKKRVSNAVVLDVLDVLNVNTAFTYACGGNRTNSILVFRKEEWFKVFIHETMHCIGLDFAAKETAAIRHKMNRRLQTLFPGTLNVSNYNITELYAEIWADVLNVLFTSIYTNQSWKSLLTKEQTFSRKQANKVLAYYKMTMADLFSSDHHPTPYPEEKVSVFSYYLGRALVFSELTSFMQFCKTHNRTYLQFINNDVNRMAFIDHVIVPSISYYHKHTKIFTTTTTTTDTDTDTTLRMTCTE